MTWESSSDSKENRSKEYVCKITMITDQLVNLSVFYSQSCKDDSILSADATCSLCRSLYYNNIKLYNS